MFGFKKRTGTTAGEAQAASADNTGASPPDNEPKGLFARLRAGLARTRANLSDGLGALLLGKKAIDQDLLDELETRLLSADVGIKATMAILDELTDRLKRKQLADSDALYAALREILGAMLQPCEVPLAIPSGADRPFVILMVGVNGVGKTTTIGKLAKRFQADGLSVMLAAGDTFRAAAVEQLQVWGERNNVPVVAQHTGADSASVIFDAYESARARKVDVLIADTAGRLHNKSNLMQELEKVVRVLKKLDADVPQEILLVLDATTGQNALSQARSFTESVKVSGLVLSKLDGTAKGGVVFAIAKELGLPLRFIGVGEKAEDLRPFSAHEFIDALFANGNSPGQS
jgi:fused signal recognition particle receptor